MLVLKNHKLILIAVLAITISMPGVFFEDAFATIGAGLEYQPTQPNALASYSNSTNQVQVNWDFSAAGAPTTCFLKGDIYYNSDLESSQSLETRVPSFTPIYYSPVTATPVTYGGNNNAEIVDCTGSMRIDIDTLMSHSTNVNNYPDLEIFLTFYAPDSNGDYNAANQYRIDEVFVMYAPDKIFTQPTYQGYGCNSQIGSTLYIDGSGSGGSVIAYGDNGDNCGDHLYLENNEYVNISPDDTDTSPADESGVVTYGTHVESSYSLLTEVYYGSVVDVESGTDCFGDCQAPLMGQAPNGSKVVQEGFSYNGHSVDVLPAHTPFPLITAQVGEDNHVTAKIYESTGLDSLRRVQFSMGLEKVSTPVDLAEVIIDIWIRYGGSEITDIIITDDNNLIDRDSIFVEAQMVNCRTGTDTQCASITLHHTYRESPIYNTMKVMVMDIYRYSAIYSFNDGVEVLGESMNPANITYTHVPSQLYPQQRGLIELTSIDRSEQLWVDKYGYVWQGDDSKMVLISDIPPKLADDDPKSKFFGYNNRINSHFAEYMQEQADKATILFDSSLIQNKVTIPKSYN